MDIDIDTKPTFDRAKVFPKWTVASMVSNGELIEHPVGIYPLTIPVDPITNLSAIPYKQIPDDVFKIDFLHLNLYNHFESRTEIEELIKLDPPWELLKSPGVVKQLAQIGKHFDIVSKVKPTSVIELSDVLTLIRPGKRWLLDKYLEDRDYGRHMMYLSNDNDTYQYKKAHSVAYSLVIVLQLHLISAGISI